MRGGLVKARPAMGVRNTLEREAQESYVLGESLNRFLSVTDSRVEQSPEGQGLLEGFRWGAGSQWRGMTMRFPRLSQDEQRKTRAI